MANNACKVKNGKIDSSSSESELILVVEAGTSGLRRSARGTPSKKSMISETNSSGGKVDSCKAELNLDVATGERSGLRRSARDSPAKRTTGPGSSTTPVKRTLESADLGDVTPLRRSERGKNQSVGLSETKTFEKTPSSSDAKERKAKSTSETTHSGKKSAIDVKAGKKRTDAKTNGTLPKHHPTEVITLEFCREKEKSVEGCRRGGLSYQVGEHNSCIKSGREELGQDCSSRFSEESNKIKEKSEDTIERLYSNQKCTPDGEAYNDRDGSRNLKGDDCLLPSSCKAVKQNDNGLDSATKKQSHSPKCVVLVNGMSGIGIGLDEDNLVTSSKRKSDAMSVDDNTVSVVENQARFNEILGSIASLPSKCISKKICLSCTTRQRVGQDLHIDKTCFCGIEPSPCLPDPCSKDRRESEAGGKTLPAEDCGHLKELESVQGYGMSLDTQICLVCKMDGYLLCCAGQGCKRGYHLSCLDPPLAEVPLGIWHCLDCIKKKIELGVHSVTEGVESVWDVREEEVSRNEGLERHKQFFVKYKGLAHVHNRWVPESLLLNESPLLAEEFNKANQVTTWKQEWTVPRRFLQKRLLPVSKKDEEYLNVQDDVVECQYEWLVKWCGLGYEHSTWELENASSMKAQEALRLAREFQIQHENAKRVAAPSRLDKFLEKKNKEHIKLSQLPLGYAPRLGNYDLDFINRLFEHWHRGQNALVIDEQERILKAVLFISSLVPSVSQPFLIISSPDVFYSLDNEFSSLAPSVHVVVYDGDNNVRKSIRTLEFHEESSVTFQVLITSPEVIIEDLDFLCMKWEAIMVDECQLPRMFSHFVTLKRLCTDMMLLFVSGHPKDGMAEHLLSLLDSRNELNVNDGFTSSSHEGVSNIKEQLSKYIVEGCKSESSRFVEYWVPVELSNLQLEQYCSILLSNSLALCSPSKSDPVGALRNILNSTRKCCDHPYLTDPMLSSVLSKEVEEIELLNIGVKASGKLQLLEAMLFEMKKLDKRVLILFQASGSSGKDNIGDFLDDFLRQRFGPDSYERIDMFVSPRKKSAAVNKFNTDKGRFAFLLETRACSSSIKLSSVDSVIIFGSDWNPVNDVRVLQKAIFDSQFECIKLFRLYSSYTVEEKALILAKQDKDIDSNLQNTNRSTSDLLLMWGSSYLFNRLDKFHRDSNQDLRANISLEQSLPKDVFQEFLSILTQDGEESDISNCSKVLKVKHIRGGYRTSYPLFGEAEVKGTYEEQPYVYWKKLLLGKQPKWRYSSGPCQRNRKRVQHFDDVPKKAEVGSDAAIKKRIRTLYSNSEPSFPKPSRINQEICVGNKEGTETNMKHTESQLSQRVSDGGTPFPSISTHLSNSSSEVAEPCSVRHEEGRIMHDSQKSLYFSLKPEIIKLCKVFQFPVNVKHMVEEFLEYVMNNHHVHREPTTIFQAFQISLCWTAASILKHKIDHTESLALAKQHLNFSCKKEEADHIYSMLRCVKKAFLLTTEKCEVAYCKESESSVKGVDSERNSNPTTSQEAEVQNDLSISVEGVEKNCENQMLVLLENQREEKEELNRNYIEEMAQLNKKKRLEVAVIRLHSTNSVAADKLKSLDHEYALRFEELKCQMDIQLKDLETMQLTARKLLQEQIESLKTPSLETATIVCNQENVIYQSSKVQIPNEAVLSKSDEEVQMTAHETATARGLTVHGHTLPDSDFLITVPRHVNSESGDTNHVSENTPSCEKGLPSKEPNHDKSESSMPSSDFALQKPCIANCSESMDGLSVNLTPSTVPIGNAPSYSVVANAMEHCNTSIENDEINSRESDYYTARVNRSDWVERINNELLHSSDRIITDSDQHNTEDAASLLESADSGSKGLGTSTSNGDPVISDNNLTGNKTIREDEGADNVASESTPGVDQQENAVCRVNQMSHSLDSVSDSDQQGGEFSTWVPENTLSQLIEGVWTSSNDDFNAGVDLQFEVDSHILSSANTYMVEPANPMAQMDTMSFNQAHEDEGSIRATTIRLTDRNTSGEETYLQQVEIPLTHSLDTMSFQHSDIDARVIGHEAQQQLPFSGDSHSNLSASNLPTTCEMRSAPTVIEPESQQQVPLPEDSHSILSAPNLSTTCELSSARTSEVHATNMSSHPPELPDSHVNVSNQTVLQPGICLAPHLPLDASTVLSRDQHAQNGSSVFPLISRSLYHDPLQTELERLRKEMDQTVVTHDQTKLQLNFNCDKEIEDVVAQIRIKYETKRKDMEAEFLVKKKEIEENLNKVLMNKFLAEAFRSKCMDTRVIAAPPGLPQGTNLRLLQRQTQQTTQQTGQIPLRPGAPSAAGLHGNPRQTAVAAPPLPPHITVPRPVTAPPQLSPHITVPRQTAVIPAPPVHSHITAPRQTAVITSPPSHFIAHQVQPTRQQTGHIPLHADVPSTAGLHRNSRQTAVVPPAPPSRIIPTSQVNQQARGPLIPVSRPSSSLLSGALTRAPPHMTSISRPISNLQNSGERRAPPHLQPYRPPSSSEFSNLAAPSSLPTQNFLGLPNMDPSLIPEFGSLQTAQPNVVHSDVDSEVVCLSDDD